MQPLRTAGTTSSKKHGFPHYGPRGDSVRGIRLSSSPRTVRRLYSPQGWTFPDSREPEVWELVTPTAVTEVIMGSTHFKAFQSCKPRLQRQLGW